MALLYLAYILVIRAKCAVTVMADGILKKERKGEGKRMGQIKKKQFVPFLTSDHAMVLISQKTVHN